MLSIPCHKALRVELKSMPRVADTILVGEWGKPLTASALGFGVRKQLRDMGVRGYVIHGLRKNAAVALADAGCDAFEIAAITGHRTVQMVQHYAKRHDQRRRARSAMDKWEAQTGFGKPANIARNRSGKPN
jgi:integrase